MKHRLLFITGLSAALLLSGCNSQTSPASNTEYGNDFTIEADENKETQTVDMIEEQTVSAAELLKAPEIGSVMLPDYKNLVIEMDEPEPEEVSEDDLSYYVQAKLAEHLSEVKDRGVEAGDILTIDFNGTINGEPFDGGQGTDTQFMIGNGELLDDFEKVLYNQYAGDTCIATVVFPENYFEELSDKTATFEITIKKVEQIPELTKDFVAEHTKIGSETIGDYYNELEAEYLVILKNQYRLSAVHKGIEELTTESEIEATDEFKQYITEYYHDDFEKWLAKSGITLEQYKEMYKLSDEDVESDIQTTIDENMPRFAVLKHIAETENLTISDSMILDYYRTYYGEEQTIESLKELYEDQYELIELQIAVFSYLEDHISISYKEPETEFGEIKIVIPDPSEGNENTVIDVDPEIAKTEETKTE